MTSVVCAMLGNHSNGKSEMSERGKTVFERETSSFTLDYSIGDLSTGEIWTLEKFFYLSLFCHGFSQGKSKNKFSWHSSGLVKK